MIVEILIVMMRISTYNAITYPLIDEFHKFALTTQGLNFDRFDRQRRGPPALSIKTVKIQPLCCQGKFVELIDEGVGYSIICTYPHHHNQNLYNHQHTINTTTTTITIATIAITTIIITTIIITSFW